MATTRGRARTAWSCACGFAPKWTRGEDGTWTAAAARETLRLFTGDVLRLCVLEDGDDVTVFCGVADGTVRAFDASTTTPRDLGAVGGDAKARREVAYRRCASSMDVGWCRGVTTGACSCTTDANAVVARRRTRRNVWTARCTTS